MTPFEKSLAQECALRALKVTRQARQEDIKAAWRRRIIESHPDRNDGADDQFQLIQAAYAVAQGTASDATTAYVLDKMQPNNEASVADIAEPVQSSPRRMRVKTRLLWHNPQDTFGKPKKVETVQLADTVVQHVADAAALEAPAPNPASNPASDAHQVQRVRQKGRRVSYIIWSLVKMGTNQVAIPTGDFRRAGGCHEVDLQFTSAVEGAATVSIPEEQRSAHFPGAQSVRVHFSHGAEKRP